MATYTFEFKDLIKYNMSLLAKTKKVSRRDEKNFLRREGTKLRRWTVQEIRRSGIDVNHVKRAGSEAKHYVKTVKRGRPYVYNDRLAIRVYSGSPHAHLLEYGHEKVGHTPQKRKLGGKTRDFRPFEKAYHAFENQFYSDCLAYYEGAFHDLWSK